MTSQVDIWQASIQDLLSFEEHFTLLLSEEERHRADRFCFSKDRSRFMASRGLLRQALSHYLQKNPKDISLSYNLRGKPFLQNSHVQFSLSHSKDLLLIGVTQEQAVGVDIEEIRNEIECDQIASRYFSKRESEMLKRLPASEKVKSFYNLWVCKEAYAKALGLGLLMPLNELEFGRSPPPWFVYRIDLGSLEATCSAALAIKGQMTSLKRYRWKNRQNSLIYEQEDGPDGRISGFSPSSRITTPIRPGKLRVL